MDNRKEIPFVPLLHLKHISPMPQRDVILKNQDKTGLLVDRSHQILFPFQLHHRHKD